MNREEHFTLGFVLLFVSYFVLKYFNLFHLFGYAGFLLIGSVLPDVIEPAKHYTHRNFFHSKRFLKILAYSLLASFVIGFLINPVF